MFIRTFFRKYWWHIAANIAMSMVTAGSALAILVQINHLVEANSSDHLPEVLAYCIGWLAALLISGIVAQYISSIVGAKFVSGLREELSTKFISMRYETFINEKSPLLGSFIHDIAQIAPLAIVLPLFSYNLLFTVAGISYLLYLSPALTAIILAQIMVMLPVSLYVWRATNRTYEKQREIDGILFDAIGAISTGKKEMSLNLERAEHYMTRSLQPSIRESERAMATGHFQWGAFQVWSSSVLYTTLVSAVLMSKYYFMMAPGDILSFVLGCTFIAGPIGFLVNTAGQINRGISSIKQMRRFTHDDSAAQALAERPNTFKRDWLEIELRNATFSFLGSDPESSTIGPINLKVTKGEHIFIVGTNGSGKSTVLLMISSLLTPISGDILLDGKPVDRDIIPYRNLFSSVFYDFHVFRHVLNSSGEPISDDDGALMLKTMKIDREVSISEGQLSRVTLSTGQRKRLALLQSIVEDRDIFLFDEVAADQDPAFKRFFYREILSELKSRGKTAIIVSHDENYFGSADRVVTLELGRIVDDDRNELH